MDHRGGDDRGLAGLLAGVALGYLYAVEAAATGVSRSPATASRRAR
jgi:hypothetical protein